MKSIAAGKISTVDLSQKWVMIVELCPLTTDGCESMNGSDIYLYRYVSSRQDFEQKGTHNMRINQLRISKLIITLKYQEYLTIMSQRN